MEDDFEPHRSTPRYDDYEEEGHSSHHHHHSSRGTTERHSSHSHHHHHRESIDFDSRPSAGEPRTGALFLVPVLLVLLVLGPLFYFQYDKDRKLTRENDLLRAEVVRLSTELATMKAAPEEALAALKPREEMAAAPSPRPAPAPVVVPPEAPRLPMRPIVRKTTAEKATPAQQEQGEGLRKELDLAPDGTFLSAEASGRIADSCAPALETAFYALSRGAMEDAAVTLEGLVESKPLWPYGHFYLAVATGSEGSFRQAQKLLLEARILRAIPPEGELYLCLASLFLKEQTMAKEALARLEASSPDYVLLPLGPLYAPKEAPADLLERLRGLSARGLPKIVLLEVRKAAR